MTNYLKNNNGLMAMEVTMVFLVVLLLAFTMVAFISPSSLQSKDNAASSQWSSFDSIYVKDQAQLLSDSTKQKIHENSAKLDHKSKAQIVVMTVPSLKGTPIQDYSLEQFRSQGIGDKDLNNGILLLVSKEDRKLRIEIGYGLEGAIPDGMAGEIVREIMIPKFKKGQYEAGISAGYFALSKEANKEYKTSLHGGSNGGGGVQAAW